MAKAGMPVQLGGAMAGKEKKQIQDFLSEARVRWNRYHQQVSSDQLPSVLLQLSPQQKTVVVIDLLRSRLYLYENDAGSPRLLTDLYVSSGKNGEGKRLEGDMKTPTGTYFITRSLDISKLPDMYGTGAFPIDYPNAWDKRHGYTGYGIWLHGVPSNTFSRAPRSSEGCLALNNNELTTIMPFFQSGITPVLIGQQLDWSPRSEIEKRRTELSRIVEQWRSDWQSLDTEAYLAHYSRQFRGDKKDYKTWVTHKTRVNSSKKFIKVELSELSILGYPEEDDMVVVSYRQSYTSDTFNGSSNKRQYWRKEADGRWRIIYEGRG
jgi:murein L,D-transpeptidase YafK